MLNFGAWFLQQMNRPQLRWHSSLREKQGNANECITECLSPQFEQQSTGTGELAFDPEAITLNGASGACVTENRSSWRRSSTLSFLPTSCYLKGQAGRNPRFGGKYVEDLRVRFWKLLTIKGLERGATA
jgi:hypothetical protein